MLTDADKRDIVRSWRLVVPIAETAAELFYKRLFELKPEYVELFPADMSGQRRKLVTMLSFIVKSLDWMQEDWEEEIDPEDDLALVVLAMGRRHASLYKIPDESYDFVGAALIWTLEQGLGDAFTPDLQDSWTRLYKLLATTMKIGGRSARVEMDLGRVA